MKKTVFLLLVLLIMICPMAAAQYERTNEAQAVIGKRLSQLNCEDNVVYWIKSVGAWTSFKEDMIINMEIREITYNDNSYYGLFVLYRDGYYRYPNLKIGWVDYNSFFIYVFEKEQLAKFDNIEIGKPAEVILSTNNVLTITRGDTKGDYNKKYSSAITTAFMLNTAKGILDYKFILIRLKSDEQDIIRFVFEHGGNHRFLIPSEIRGHSYIPISEDTLIKGPYYETKTSYFYSLFLVEE